MVKEWEMLEEGKLQSECVVMGTLKIQLIGIPFQGCERRYYKNIIYSHEVSCSISSAGIWVVIVPHGGYNLVNQHLLLSLL